MKFLICAFSAAVAVAGHELHDPHSLSYVNMLLTLLKRKDPKTTNTVKCNYSEMPCRMSKKS